jgi:hypothetical protein
MTRRIVARALALGIGGIIVFVVLAVIVIQPVTVTEVSTWDLRLRSFQELRFRDSQEITFTSRPEEYDTPLSEWIRANVREGMPTGERQEAFAGVWAAFHWGPDGRGDAAVFVNRLRMEDGDRFWARWSQKNVDEARDFWNEVLQQVDRGDFGAAMMLVSNKRVEISQIGRGLRNRGARAGWPDGRSRQLAHRV